MVRSEDGRPPSPRQGSPVRLDMHERWVTGPGPDRTPSSPLMGLAGALLFAVALVVIAVIFTVVMLVALGVTALSLVVRALVPGSRQRDRVQGSLHPGAVIETTARVIRSAGAKSTR